MRLAQGLKKGLKLMGAVKNQFHDEICAAADDQRVDEFDCYEARLHSLLSELDWLADQPETCRNQPAKASVANTQSYIKRLMG
jgi:hypothetical protein